MNVHVQELFNDYGVDQQGNGPSYPQGSGQKEATNKTLLCIVSKMANEEPKVG